MNSIDSMMNNRSLLPTPDVIKRMMQYGLIALVIAGVELVVFQASIQLLNLSVSLAVTISVGIAFILNWHVSLRVVFQSRSSNYRREFWWTMAVSIAGLFIQIQVTNFCVHRLQLLPLHGKLVAIGVTFFWNFLWREKYIFNHPKNTFG